MLPTLLRTAGLFGFATAVVAVRRTITRLFLYGVVAVLGAAGLSFLTAAAWLAANGSDRNHLLSALIFITDMKLKPDMNKAWKAWLAPAHLPSRATIGINDLGPGVLIEVVVTAAVK